MPEPKETFLGLKNKPSPQGAFFKHLVDSIYIWVWGIGKLYIRFGNKSVYLQRILAILRE